ncbi:MAG: hypothetical protein LBK67_04635 [Coriobacteriales bacterium]|jgi:hypothetical protein|nr:hypothetical protein [Coriobacteriales bacterium]
MLKENMIQEIQDLKAAGYSIAEVIEYYDRRAAKGPSRPTIRKYYNMDGVPKDHGVRLKKEMAFDTEPFRGDIVRILENNPECYISSVYDVLEERFVDTGAYGALPGNAQTLRNYVHHLKAIGAIECGEQRMRTYDHVDDTPPGQQMLIDFGQQDVGRGLTVHFVCLLFRLSRLLGVYAQDHAFNGEEACRAIYRFFTKCKGRPKELVIDQDAVFIASETYGEVIETRVFGDFLREQSLTLWVCNKQDPESKGPIENSVKFVKSNYFSARTITSIEEVERTLPGWLERKNNRIHQATFKVPKKVFTEIERPALACLVPSVYEYAPLNLIGQEVRSQPFISYKSSKYSVPWDCCYTKVYYRAIGGSLYIYDANRRHLCTHAINMLKGSFNRLKEHDREPSVEWMVIVERLRSKYNCFKFQHLINGFRKENGRHLTKQLIALENFLDSERPDPGLVSEVFCVCCEHWRYKITQFRATYELVKAGRASALSIQMSDVDKRGLEGYQEAFRLRCEG